MNAPAIRYVSAFYVRELLGCSYHAALKHMRRVGVYKIGALVRVREDELHAYVARCREPDRPASTSAPAEAAALRKYGFPTKEEIAKLKR